MVAREKFDIILLGFKQLYKLWKKTFKTFHQLSCFVGHSEFKMFLYIWIRPYFSLQLACFQIILKQFPEKGQ